MSADILKMNYLVMDDLGYAIGDAIETLENTQAELIRLADLLAQGALISQGGVALEHVLRHTLHAKTQRLNDVYLELCHDVAGAVQEMQAAGNM